MDQKFRKPYKYSNSTMDQQPKKAYLPKAIGVKEYGYQEDFNMKFRQYMEDYHFVIDNILEDPSKSILFGILDGHGGKDIAEYVSKNFPKFSEDFQRIIQSLLKKHSFTLRKMLSSSKKIDNKNLLQMDSEVSQYINSQEMGSTASIGFIRYEQANRVLYMANVGDSKAVLFTDSSYQVLTEMHNGDNQLEKTRITKAGGGFFFNRVGGVLAVSRAIGDHVLRDQGVIANPFINKLELRLIHKWIIVASDGLWDVMTENVNNLMNSFLKDVLQILKQRSTADEVSQILIKTALQLESKDNISILCLKLN